MTEKKDRPLGDQRKGAVLNQIMRKFLGEDDVILLKKELDKLTEGLNNLCNRIDAVSDRTTVNWVATDKRVTNLERHTLDLRKDLDKLRSFLVNDTNVMVDRDPFNNICPKTKKALKPLKAEIPVMDDNFSMQINGKATLIEQPKKKSGRPVGVKETKPRRYKSCKQ